MIMCWSGGFCGNVDPALVLMAGDLNGDEAGGRVAGYAARARRDHVVDVAGPPSLAFGYKPECPDLLVPG